MARLGTALLKGAGVALLALIVLGVVATVVSIVLSIVATVVAAVVTMAILAVFVLAVVGLGSLLWGDDADTGVTGDPPTRSAETAAPADRLRSRYVDGELSEAEFERELDRLLEADGGADRLDLDRTRESTNDRSRLWDR